MDFETYLEERNGFWNETYQKNTTDSLFSRFYQEALKKYYRFIIPEGRSVLELGCGTGDLLRALKPSKGVGIDFSSEAILRAEKAGNENICFYCSPIESIRNIFPMGETFDFIILSDLINDLWNVQQVLETIRAFCRPDTRIVLNFYSRVWQLPLDLARKLKLAKPQLKQNWFTPEDVKNILNLSGYEFIKQSYEFILPFSCPIIEPLFNRFFARLWPFRLLDLVNIIIARPERIPSEKEYKVTVCVPARNEEGNIERIIESVPKLGSGTELIFVEGNSTDRTYEKIKTEIAKHPEKDLQLFQQTGKGKGDAVRMGYSHASGDILMILDADLTVSPDMLTDFYKALTENRGEFINGVRLVYPMESEAMRFANLLGNKAFSLVFSWMLGQPIKDTLCGTKVMWKRDYEVLARNRSYFGKFDPFGDYDLLFGAAKMNLKIIDLPIRYKDRTYGTTNISRWRHGVILLRMVLYAARKLKFY